MTQPDGSLLLHQPLLHLPSPETTLAFSPAFSAFLHASSPIPSHHPANPITYITSSSVTSTGGPIICGNFSSSSFSNIAHAESSPARTPNPRPFMDSTWNRRKRTTSPALTTGSDF